MAQSKYCYPQREESGHRKKNPLEGTPKYRLAKTISYSALSGIWGWQFWVPDVLWSFIPSALPPVAHRFYPSQAPWHNCSFPRQMYHSPGIFNILKSPLQLILHLTEDLAGPPCACHTLPGINCSRRLPQPSILHLSCLQSQYNMDRVAKFHCQLAVSPASLDHSYIDLGAVTPGMYFCRHLLWRAGKYFNSVFIP